MSSANRQSSVVQWEATLEQRYFIITATNYPILLLHTQELQELPEQHSPHPQHANAASASSVQIYSDMLHSEEHEQMLYNTLRFELLQIIQGYLQRTRQPYPIKLVFDFSGVQVQRL